MDPIDLSIQLDRLILVSWILLIPIGVLTAIVLAKLMFILHGVSEFMTLSRYELYPTLKDLRTVAERADALSEKALNASQSIERGIEAAGTQAEKIKQAAEETISSIGGPIGSVFRAAWLLIQDDRKRKQRRKEKERAAKAVRE